MSKVSDLDVGFFYSRFHSPITDQDCGAKCAPYNEYGVPFCCDTKHAIPTAYDAEWDYLVHNTDLWHEWDGGDKAAWASLRSEIPQDQVLIECLGHQFCQRAYRSITCRSFPFFPYITDDGRFIGLSYYWEYEDRCWVISNLSLVNRSYRQEFVGAYEELFVRYPHEINNFAHHSKLMRDEFHRQQRAIPLLHRNGAAYKITPKNGRLRRVSQEKLPKFGVYKIASQMRFADEEPSLG